MSDTPDTSRLGLSFTVESRAPRTAAAAPVNSLNVVDVIEVDQAASEATPPSVWWEYYDSTSHQVYFFNPDTAVSTWDEPTGNVRITGPPHRSGAGLAPQPPPRTDGSAGGVLGTDAPPNRLPEFEVALVETPVSSPPAAASSAPADRVADLVASSDDDDDDGAEDDLEVVGTVALQKQEQDADFAAPPLSVTVTASPPTDGGVAGAEVDEDEAPRMRQPTPEPAPVPSPSPPPIKAGLSGYDALMASFGGAGAGGSDAAQPTVMAPAASPIPLAASAAVPPTAVADAEPDEDQLFADFLDGDDGGDDVGDDDDLLGLDDVVIGLDDDGDDDALLDDLLDDVVLDDDEVAALGGMPLRSAPVPPVDDALGDDVLDIDLNDDDGYLFDITNDDVVAASASPSSAPAAAPAASAAMPDDKAIVEILRSAVPPPPAGDPPPVQQTTPRQKENVVDYAIGDEADRLRVGIRVEIYGFKGTVRYLGPTHEPGLWAGIELDEPEGFSDGTLHGMRYFDCKDRHGKFAKAASCQVVE